MSVCYVGLYGKKHRPCQTPTSTRSKKACAETGRTERGQRQGNSIPGIKRVWNHREEDMTEKYSIRIFRTY